MNHPDYNPEIVDRVNATVTSVPRFGIVFLLAKDRQNHQRLCQDYFKSVDDLFWKWRVAKTYLLAETDDSSDSDPMRIPQFILTDWAFDGMGPDERNLIRAMAAYRSSQPEKTLEFLKAASASNRLAIRGSGQILHSMALAKLGRFDEGRKILAQAEANFGTHLKTLTGDLWWDLAMCQVLLEEAHRVFAEKN